MTRIALLSALALAVLSLGERESVLVVVGGEEPAQAVVLLRSPPLAEAPGTAARIDAEQRAFRRELARELPRSRVHWRYRLVANGFSVVGPASELARVHELAGVRDVVAPATYGAQLDNSPQQIGAPTLWGTGLATAGQGVRIGIVDSGVDHTHPFFDPAGYTMPSGFPKGQARFTNAKVIVARAFPPPTARTHEARLAFDGENSDHGTHVAGIAAGNHRTQAGGRMVSGIAPRAYIGNYKALVRTDAGLSPNGNSPELVAAIEAAVADGMDVINLSLGEPEIEPRRDIVALALDAAAAAGVVPVVAAGNDYNDVGAGSVSSPANSARAITVGAVEVGGSPLQRVHADFSSVGPTTISLRAKPDVAAPGVGILSSVPDGWGTSSGTSMASPHVAGAAALLRQRHPAWTVAQIKSALTLTGVDATGDAGAVIGPQFQGGGVISLAAADAPLVFADPSSVSFGLLARGATASGAIALADAGGGAGTWEVSATRQGTSAGAAAVTVPATVEVPGALAWQVAVPAAAAQGDVAGYLVLRRGADVRRIPFWGRVAVAELGRHRVRELTRAGVYRGTTAGRPALVSRYRYPESPRGIGVTTVLSGPELVYRFRLTRAATNFGVVVTSRGQRSRVEPRVVAGLDENRLTGYAGLPVNHNPYHDGFRRPLLAAGALSPRPGEYAIVFDSATRGGAGRFTFRFWIDDVRPPTVRLVTRSLRRGAPVRITATDAGSGVYSIAAAIDGVARSASYDGRVIRVSTSGLAAGRHVLAVTVSDYQESKNTENVRRILPNTRTLRTTFTVRP